MTPGNAEPQPQLDLDFVRAQFPAFSEPSLEGWIHMENAGGSYACGQVIDRLNRYYVANKLQPYAWSDASIEAGRQMDAARERFAAMLNVDSSELHFGPSTTQNTYVLAQAVRQRFQPGDEIVVTNLDHEANIGPWRRLENDGFVLREWRIDPDSGELNTADLDALLSDRTRVVAFSHCSNVVGGFNPVRSICDRAHEAGAWAVVDGVSYCGHGIPDVAALGADAYLFSLYKVYGTHLGVMTLNSAMNEALPNQGHYFNDGKATARMTPAGPDHAQIAASNGVIDYLEAVHQHHGGRADASPTQIGADTLALFQAQEHRLLQPLLDFLDQRQGVRLIGRNQAATRAPTVSISVAGRNPVTLAEALAEDRIGASAGHFYASRCVEGLGLDPNIGVLRMSFVHYTDMSDIQRLIECLDRQL